MIKLFAAFAIALLALSGCSSSDSPSDQPSGSAATVESPEAVTSVLPPIDVDGAGSVDAKVGNVLDVTTDGVVEVTTDNPDVLQVFVPTETESAQFNGGAKAIGEGSANMIVYGADNKKLYTVQVTVKGSLPSMSPSTVG